MMNGAATLLHISQEDGSTGLSIQEVSGLTPNYPNDLYRLYMVHSDDTSITLDGQSLRVGCGQLLTLSPGEVIMFNGEHEVESLCFHHDFFCVRVQRDEVFCDGVVFNRVTGLPIVTYPNDEWRLFCDRADEVRRILRQQGPFSRDRVINALRAVLLQAAEYKLRSAGAQDEMGVPQGRLSPLVLEFQTLVENTYCDNRDVTFYSDRLGVTPSTLNRRLKEELGQTAMQVVSERLAIAARVALRSGQQSVKEVAFDMGFDDPLYFSRFFKKHFGAPPSQYFQNDVID